MNDAKDLELHTLRVHNLQLQLICQEKGLQVQTLAEKLYHTGCALSDAQAQIRLLRDMVQQGPAITPEQQRLCELGREVEDNFYIVRTGSNSKILGFASRAQQLRPGMVLPLG